MELLFAVLGGIIVGLVAHVILPWRAERGIGLGPAVGGSSAAVLWEIATWAGLLPGGTWIWIIALVGGGVIALVAEWLVGPRRVQSDAAYFEHERTTGRPA